MSCESPPIKSISRCALPFVVALAVCPSSAFSQTPVCHPIQRGETATQLARRITGDGGNTYQPWFQIMDGSSRFIPKSQYARIVPAGARASSRRRSRAAASSPSLNSRRRRVKPPSSQTEVHGPQ